MNAYRFILLVSVFYAWFHAPGALAIGGSGTKIVIAKSLVSQNCQTQLLAALPHLVAGSTAEVALTGLDELEFGLNLSGLDRDQILQTTRSLHLLLEDSEAPRVFKQVAGALLDAMDDDSVLGICTLHQNCLFLPGMPAAHVSSGHSFQILSLFGGQSGDKLAWANTVVPGAAGFDSQSLWQGIVVKPLPHTKPLDNGTLLLNLKSLMHEAGYFDAMSRIDRWSRYVQHNGRPHPSLAKYISADGKTVDEGFVRLVMEARALRVAVETIDVFFRQMGVGATVRFQLRARVLPQMVRGTMDSILAYGNLTQTALNDFEVTDARVFDLGEELCDLLDWRG